MAAMAKRLFGSATPSWITAVFAIVAAVFGLLGSAQKAGNKSRHLAARPSAAVMSTSSFVVASNASTANETSRGHDLLGPDQVSKLKRSLERATLYAGLGDDFWKELPVEVSAQTVKVKGLLKELYESCTTTYLTSSMRDVDSKVIEPLVDSLEQSLKLLGVLPSEIGDNMSNILLSCLSPCHVGSARLPDEQVRAAIQQIKEQKPDEFGTLLKVLMVYYYMVDNKATPEERVRKLQDASQDSKLSILQSQACPAAECQDIGEKLSQAEASRKLTHEKLGEELLKEVAKLKTKLGEIGKDKLADKLRQPPLHCGKLVGIVLFVAVAAFACYMRVV